MNHQNNHEYMHLSETTNEIKKQLNNYHEATQQQLMIRVVLCTSSFDRLAIRNY